MPKRWNESRKPRKNVERGLSVVVYTMDGSRLEPGLQKDVTQAVQKVVDGREGSAYNKNGNIAVQIVSE